MITTDIKIKSQIGINKLAISLVLIILLCLALFYLDKETKSITDLFKPGNLVALVFYALPTFIICSTLQWVFIKLNSKKYFFLAHFIGIPLGVGLVMVIFAAKMGWF